MCSDRWRYRRCLAVTATLAALVLAIAPPAGAARQHERHDLNQQGVSSVQALWTATPNQTSYEYESACQPNPRHLRCTLTLTGLASPQIATRCDAAGSGALCVVTLSGGPDQPVVLTVQVPANGPPQLALWLAGD
jgi:hypothetical protein